ncbi:MAG: hypothetical protein EBR99_08530, partial [Actinobacteria bacterium]|nr:hypothetical protein [Actinomycetota bacterium]
PTGTISITNAVSSGILGGWATYNGNDWVVSGGTTSAYSAYTADTWASGNNTNVTISGAAAAGTTNSLRFNAASALTLTLTGTNTVTSGGILVGSTAAANNQTLTGGTLTTGGSNDLVLLNRSTSGSLILNTVIDGTGGLTVSGVAITADRLAAGNPISATPALFLTAVNKTVQFGSLAFNNPGSTVTITPSNGYGVEFTGAAAISQSYTTFSVGSNGATTSNVVPSLLLSGVVSGTPATGVWTKTGAGTMLLSNSGNTFTSNIQVTNGILAFTSDAALGNSANTLILNGATSTLRATGASLVTYATAPNSISTSRTIVFNNATTANNVLEVANGTTWTINSAFGLANNG